jgi:hypothetical protein
MYLNFTEVTRLSVDYQPVWETYKVKGMDDSQFYHSYESFPMNIEVIQDFTYNATKPPVLEDTETISIQMNQSMILLPENDGAASC